VTDHPGEQFPAEVDPDVEPGFEPEPDENPEPDYDSEPGAQSSLRPSQQGVPHSDPLLAGFTMYGELPPDAPAEEEEDTEQAFEASLQADEPVEADEAFVVGELVADESVEPAAQSVDEPVERVVPAPSVFQGPRPAPPSSFQRPTPSPSVFQPRPGGQPVPAPRPAEQVKPDAPAYDAPAAGVEGAGSSQFGERDEDAPHPLVEETMARLDELRERPVGEHAEVYADLHERLQTALVEADAEDRG